MVGMPREGRMRGRGQQALHVPAGSSAVLEDALAAHTCAHTHTAAS